MTGKIRLWTRTYNVIKHDRNTSKKNKEEYLNTKECGLIDGRLRMYQPLNNFEILSGMKGLFEEKHNGFVHSVKVNGKDMEIATTLSGSMRAYRLGEEWVYFGSKLIKKKFDGRDKIKDWAQQSGAEIVSTKDAIV